MKNVFNSNSIIEYLPGMGGELESIKGSSNKLQVTRSTGAHRKSWLFIGKRLVFIFFPPTRVNMRNGNWIPKHSYAHIYFGYALSIVKRLTIFFTVF